MANQEYLVRNRMTHWQKSYPHWVSVVSIIGVLLVWELICRAGFVSSLFLPAPSQIISSLFVKMFMISAFGVLVLSIFAYFGLYHWLL